MKKAVSLVLCLTMAVALLLGNVFSASAESATIDGVDYTWDQEIQFLPEGPDDWELGSGTRVTGSREEGFTFNNLNGWCANLADTEPWEAEAGWALVYDIKIDSGTMGIRAQWWNCNVSKALVAKHGIAGGGDDGDHLTAGHYVGVLPVEEFTQDFSANIEGEDGTALDVKWLVNIYVVKGKMSVNTLKLVHLTSGDVPGGDEPGDKPSDNPKPTPATGDVAPYALAACAVLSAAALGFVSRKQK